MSSPPRSRWDPEVTSPVRPFRSRLVHQERAADLVTPMVDSVDVPVQQPDLDDAAYDAPVSGALRLPPAARRRPARGRGLRRPPRGVPRPAGARARGRAAGAGRGAGEALRHRARACRAGGAAPPCRTGVHALAGRGHVHRAAGPVRRSGRARAGGLARAGADRGRPGRRAGGGHPLHRGRAPPGGRDGRGLAGSRWRARSGTALRRLPDGRAVPLLLPPPGPGPDGRRAGAGGVRQRLRRGARGRSARLRRAVRGVRRRTVVDRHLPGRAGAGHGGTRRRDPPRPGARTARRRGAGAAATAPGRGAHRRLRRRQRPSGDARATDAWTC